jgi:SAM-dependent methyltransferase
MQKRHKNPELYFEETVTSCRNHYIPFIAENSAIVSGPGCSVLDIGCGMGGVLYAFAERGCNVTGIDIHRPSVELARDFFSSRGMDGTFVNSSVFEYDNLEKRFDIVIMHDCIEHIAQKEELMLSISKWLKSDGILYIGFPAWQMPFGGHQQMSKNRFVANCPYIHLLPKALYRLVLKLFGHSDGNIRTFMEIRDTRISIEGFERLAKKTKFKTVFKQLYFINPNYQVKFGLRPRKLSPVIARLPYIRNFVTTTCYYLLSKE